MKNIFYFRHLNCIGGIESHFYYLAREYPNYDITIYYKSADAKQLARLKKVVRCIQYEDQDIECDKAFFCFNRDIWDKVHGKKYIVLHGDYEDMINRGQLDRSNIPIMEDCDGYFGVSQTICDSFERLTGIKCTNIGQPFVQQEQKKILRFVYCGRLSKEKGAKRVEKLLNRLDERGIEYEFYCYSNGAIDNRKVKHLPTRLDVASLLNPSNYSFLVQLSDNEGYCFSVVEALTNGLPVIVTRLPVYEELKLDDTNSIKLELDCSNLDEVIDKLENNYDVHFNPPKDSWDKYLSQGGEIYKYEKERDMRIQIDYPSGATIKELDGKFFPRGSYATVSESTGQEAIKRGIAHQVEEEKIVEAEIKPIEAPKEEKVVVAKAKPKKAPAKPKKK